MYVYFLKGVFDIWKWNSAAEAQKYAVKNNLWAVRLHNSFVDHSVKSFLDLVSFSSIMIVTKLLHLCIFFLSFMILLNDDELKFS